MTTPLETRFDAALRAREKRIAELRRGRGQKTATRSAAPAPQTGKVARVPTSSAKPAPAPLASSPTKTARPPAITPKAKPAAKIKPVGMFTGERAAGPAGFLRRQASQPPAKLEDSQTFNDLAQEFWASQSIPGQ